MTLLVTLIALQVLDILTTHRLLLNGGKELNPVMASLMAKVGPIPALLIAKAALIALCAWVATTPYALPFLITMNATYGFVVAWNTVQLFKTKD